MQASSPFYVAAAVADARNVTPAVRGAAWGGVWGGMARCVGQFIGRCGAVTAPWEARFRPGSGSQSVSRAPVSGGGVGSGVGRGPRGPWEGLGGGGAAWSQHAIRAEPSHRAQLSHRRDIECGQTDGTSTHDPDYRQERGQSTRVYLDQSHSSQELNEIASNPQSY